jgi:hypothetical protein
MNQSRQERDAQLQTNISEMGFYLGELHEDQEKTKADMQEA